MSHYFAQEMFSKVLVSPTLPPPYNTLKVSIVSDHLEPLLVELLVKIQRWDELENHYRGSLSCANFITKNFITAIFSKNSINLPYANFGPFYFIGLTFGAKIAKKKSHIWLRDHPFKTSANFHNF